MENLAVQGIQQMEDPAWGRLAAIMIVLRTPAGIPPIE
jgi:hypothetical protein